MLRGLGFAVVKIGVKKKGGCVNYIILACICQGKPRKEKSDVMKPVLKIIRTKCKTRICVMLFVDGTWFF
jgi:hypothetical protein